MPREHKKRGRRDEKKLKRKLAASTAESAQEPEAPSAKRPRPSHPASSPQHSQGDTIPTSTTGRQTSAPEPYDEYAATGRPPPGADEAPADEFYGLLSADDAAYFKRADAMLELDGFGSAAERRRFLASVWREAAGKELKLACAQSCSRVLERLVRASGTRQLRRLWASFAGHFLFLVQHRFASHVCEALFLNAAPAVTREIIGEEDEDEDEDQDDVGEEGGKDEEGKGGEDSEKAEVASVNTSMEDLFLQVVDELSDNLGYLMTDKFASHALRVLLVVLGGKPLDDSATTNVLQSKSKERIDSTASKAVDPAPNAQRHWRSVPSSFHTALQKTASGAVGSLDTHYLRALATHPVGNPVMQVLLELEFASQGKQNTRASPDSLFRRLLPDDPPTEVTQSATFIKGLMYDTVGSRLLEVIVQNAPGKTFKSIYRTLFRGNLPSILKNEVASFLCIRILERLGQEDLKQAVEEIAPEIPMLVERFRHSVIRVLIERCRIRELDVQPLADALKSAFGQTGPSILESMLLLSSPRAEPGSMQVEASTTQKLHASLLVQTILAQADALRDCVNDAFLAAPQAFVKVACDRQATHALQAALTAPDQSLVLRRRLIQSLLGNLTDLATDTIGAHVLRSVWDASNGGLLYLLERAAEELVRDEARVKESFSGRTVWRNWSLELYRRRREEWITRAKQSEAGPAGGATESSQKSKSAIDKAREKFAAGQSQRNAAAKKAARAATANSRGGLAVSVK